jgi:hypothetical protein
MEIFTKGIILKANLMVLVNIIGVMAVISKDDLMKD